jgi:hypothetical protein
MPHVVIFVLRLHGDALFGKVRLRPRELLVDAAGVLECCVSVLPLANERHRVVEALARQWQEVDLSLGRAGVVLQNDQTQRIPESQITARVAELLTSTGRRRPSCSVRRIFDRFLSGLYAERRSRTWGSSSRVSPAGAPVKDRPGARGCAKTPRRTPVESDPHPTRDSRRRSSGAGSSRSGLCAGTAGDRPRRGRPGQQGRSRW